MCEMELSIYCPVPITLHENLVRTLCTTVADSQRALGCWESAVFYTNALLPRESAANKPPEPQAPEPPPTLVVHVS